MFSSRELQAIAPMTLHSTPAPVHPAEIYGNVLGYLFEGRLNFDLSAKLRVGDFGVVENGNFTALINLIEPSQEDQDMLPDGFLRFPPEKPQHLKLEVEGALGQVGAGPRDLIKQGIVAVGAEMTTTTGTLASGTVQSVEGPVTVKFHQIQAAMLSLENQERKAVQLTEASKVKARRFLDQKHQQVLAAYDRSPTSKCFFINKVDACFGYCNSLQLEIPEAEFTDNPKAEFIVNHNLSTFKAVKVNGGLLHNSGKQECGLKNKEWKFVFAYHGDQWVHFGRDPVDSAGTSLRSRPTRIPAPTQPVNRPRPAHRSRTIGPTTTGRRAAGSSSPRAD